MPEPDSPALGVSIVRTEPAGETGSWNVTWRLENTAEEPLQLTESWLPHGRFRAARLSYAPPLVLASGAQALLSREAAIDVSDGGRTENAFLILRARYGGSDWRIFVRMRAELAPDGSIEPIVEAITASPATDEAPAGDGERNALD